MKRHGIPTDDLHAVSKGFNGKHFSGPGNVHFKAAGSAKLAESVVTSIETALQKAKADKSPK